MTPLQECPVCETPLLTFDENIKGVWFDCPRCGRCLVEGMMGWAVNVLADKLGDSNQPKFLHLRSRLSHLLRRQQRENKVVMIPVKQLEDWQLDAPLPSPAQQADSLILWTGEHQPSSSEWAVTKQLAMSAWLGTTINKKKIVAGLLWLLERPEVIKFLDIREVNPKTGFDTGGLGFRLTMPGWERYETLKHEQTESRTAFMAMKFGDDELNRVIAQCFRPAVAQAGYDLRVLTDRQPAGSIDDQLRVALRTARFIIADLTHANNGAYWEAGFAEGLGRPVIYTCRQQEWEKQKTHFDTNHLVTIIWESNKLDDAGKETYKHYQSNITRRGKDD